MRKLLYWTVIIAALIIGGLLLRPYFTALIFAAVFAYLTYPIYLRLNKHLSPRASAMVLTSALILVLMSLIGLGLNFIINEFSKAYVLLSNMEIPTFMQSSELGLSIKQVFEMAFLKVIESTTDFISKLPHLLLSLFIFFISFFYFLKDGDKIVKLVKKDLPVSKAHNKEIWKELEAYIHSFFYVWLIIAIVQGVIAAVGFYIFGLPYALLAGILAAILSIIPILGPYLIYSPVGIGLIITGNPVAGIGILTYGLLIGSILDYVLRPYLAGRKAAIHPLIILLGIFGGLALVGLGGIIIGPVILLGVIAVLKTIKMPSIK